MTKVMAKAHEAEKCLICGKKLNKSLPQSHIIHGWVKEGRSDIWKQENNMLVA